MAERRYPSGALRALRRGEISLRTYLADRVQHALGPLADRLTQSQLRVVAKILRARLRVDPVLTGYIERLRQPPEPLDTPPDRPGRVG
jgi:hypothetical protein